MTSPTPSGKTALVMLSDFGVEEAELTQPIAALKDAGVAVTVATNSGGTIQAVESDKDWTNTYPSDAKIADIDPAEFDLLVLPGGTVNADTLRIDPDAQSVVAKFAEAGKPVAAICHAPWVLIDAGVATGKTLTSYESVAIDLKNAGATWVDVPVQQCDAKGWRLITSRNPGDLDAFGEALVAELTH